MSAHPALEAQSTEAAMEAVEPSPNGTGPASAIELHTCSIEEFAAVVEPGADALIGDGDNALIPEAGDCMVYGDGGSGKTTLCLDMALHLAAGDPWLQIPIPRAVNVLIVENEGPRALFRKKLARKLAGWRGSAIQGRIRVYEKPWHGFTFADEGWREALAAEVRDQQIDVLIAGPLTRVGMDEAGTLQQVRDFMGVVDDLRQRCGRRLTVVIVHHEGKNGTVSGAWEGAGDTLLHVRKAGSGHTTLFVQKARWDSERHGQTMKLLWTDGEGFKIEGERDLFALACELFEDERWRTVDEIREGVKAGTDAVRTMLDGHLDAFQMRTGDEAKCLGRSSNAQLYMVAR